MEADRTSRCVLLLLLLLFVTACMTILQILFETGNLHQARDGQIAVRSPRYLKRRLLFDQVLHI